MNLQLFDERDLPLEDLQKIGLAVDGKLHIDKDDLDALLSGRRTTMLRLENLNSDGFSIPALDTKLSLRPGPDGELQLLLHPIYRKAEKPAWLTDTEAEKLERGEAFNVEAYIYDDEGKPQDVLVEFDKETNEFIVTDTKMVQAPDKVNNEPLSPEQKERYKKGREVEQPDGTRFQFSAAEPKGMRSNRVHLIASVLIDGGVSYFLYHGLNALMNRKQDKSPEVNNSGGYKAAEREMKKQEKTTERPLNEHSRGYSRSGNSR